MNIKIFPSKVKGKVTAPPSKSMTHRAAVIASLAKGTSVVKNALVSNDTMQTINACRAFGVKIKRQGATLTIKGSGGQLVVPKKTIKVNNSGTTMRFITAIAALATGTTVISGSKRMHERPMKELLQSLKALSIKTKSLAKNGHAPLKITGGKILGGEITIKPNASSQFVSALLLVAPFAKKGLRLKIEGRFPSKPYVDTTIMVMNKFGVKVQNDNYRVFIVRPGQAYQATTMAIEGDFSSASYLFAAAAVTGGQVSVGNLNLKLPQADKVFLNILTQMGCQIEDTDHQVTVKGNFPLRGITVDMENCPDTVQTLSAVASYAVGKTHIKNIGHLTYKETDRITDTARELKKIGVEVSHNKNSLTIAGRPPKGGVINTHEDHRMAMSMAIAALGAKRGIMIKNAEVISKSYPGFWQDLARLGVKMEVVKR